MLFLVVWLGFWHGTGSGWLFRAVVDAEHGELGRDPLELFHRGLAGYGDARPRSGRDIEVPAQDRSALVHQDSNKTHRVTAAADESGLSPSGPHVAHLVGPAAQHRDEIARSFAVGHHDGQR